MGSLGDEEFMRWEFKSYKLLGSNPGSLLRSKSTRHAAKQRVSDLFP